MQSARESIERLLEGRKKEMEWAPARVVGTGYPVLDCPVPTTQFPVRT
jgi:hypothetical protein